MSALARCPSSWGRTCPRRPTERKPPPRAQRHLRSRAVHQAFSRARTPLWPGRWPTWRLCSKRSRTTLPPSASGAGSCRCPRRMLPSSLGSAGSGRRGPAQPGAQSEALLGVQQRRGCGALLVHHQPMYTYTAHKELLLQSIRMHPRFG